MDNNYNNFQGFYQNPQDNNSNYSYFQGNIQSFNDFNQDSAMENSGAKCEYPRNSNYDRNFVNQGNSSENHTYEWSNGGWKSIHSQVKEPHHRCINDPIFDMNQDEIIDMMGSTNSFSGLPEIDFKTTHQSHQEPIEQAFHFIEKTFSQFRKRVNEVQNQYLEEDLELSKTLLQITHTLREVDDMLYETQNVIANDLSKETPPPGYVEFCKQEHIESQRKFAAIEKMILPIQSNVS